MSTSSNKPDLTIPREANDVAIRIGSLVKRQKDNFDFCRALSTNPRKLMTMTADSAFHEAIENRVQTKVKDECGYGHVAIINGRTATDVSLEVEFEQAIRDKKILILIKFMHCICPVAATGPEMESTRAKGEKLLTLSTRLTDLDCENVVFIGLIDSTIPINDKVKAFPTVSADTGPL